jgi:catechol 2,3-dioxygenase-like lactoylglutathione lyase family enzyme
MTQANQDRRIDYVEFSTASMEDAKRFYSNVFGWELTDYGPGGSRVPGRGVRRQDRSRGIRVFRWTTIPLCGPERERTGSLVGPMRSGSTVNIGLADTSLQMSGQGFTRER